MRRVVLTLVIALGVGGVAGYLSRSSAGPEREVEMKRSVREERGEMKDWSGDDLVRATRERMKNLRGNSALSRQLADWTTDEIRSALEESVKSPDSIFRSTPGSQVEYALIVEWMKRNHEEAVAWFETVESDYAKARLATLITGEWPKEDAMAGLNFYLSHRALHGQWWPYSLHTNVFNQAAASGPAALEAVLRRYGEENIHTHSTIELEFPAGFDFRTLAAGEEFQKLEKRGGSTPLLRAWSEMDPAGAFSWMMEQGGMKKASSMATAYGKDSEQRLKWLGGEMNTWSAEQRKELVDHALLSWSMKPEALKYLAEGVKDPAQAEELRAYSIQAIYEGWATRALPVLGDIPDPSRRIELLLAAEPSPVLEKDMDRAFPAVGEAIMRNTLRDWNATPEQIETIIQRFKP